MTTNHAGGLYNDDLQKQAIADKPLNFHWFGNVVPSDEEVAKYHFDYIRPDEQTTRYIENCRNQYKQLLRMLHTIPPSRERSLAITKLEESLVFATKGIVVAFKQEGS